MKILNVNITIDPVTGGGTAERTLQMSRFLARAGMECTLLTTNVGLTKQRIKDLVGVKVIILRTLNKRFYIPKFSFNMLGNMLKNVDIIHLMNHWTLLNAIVYLGARHLNRPYVVCPAGALAIYGRSKFFKRVYNWFIGKRIILNANGHIAIAGNEINQFQVYGVGPDQISVIPNGINPEDFQANDTKSFRDEYGLGNVQFIMFIGRLNSIKGPDLLLRAFCNAGDMLKAFHLVFVGPDEGLLADLQDIVAEAGVGDRVHFIGYLDGEDKSQAYHAADLVVVPSRQEAMSIVALEAGITGTPILMTDQCGFDEVATVGAGKVVAASVDALQEGLVELLRDPVQLKSMGENLRRYTCENFLWNSVVNKYIELYRQLLN